LTVALAVTGTLTTSSNDTLDLEGFNLSGPVVTFTNNGILRLKGSETTVSLPAGALGGTVVYYGNGGGTISGLKAGNSYTNLSFTSAAGVMVYQLTVALAVTGTLTTSSNDTLDLEGFNLSGPVVTFTNNGTLRLKGSETTVALPATAIGGTVVYYGNGGGTISGLKAGNSYSNLSFTSAAGVMVYQLTVALAVTGTLTTSSNDTLSALSFGLTVGGTT